MFAYNGLMSTKGLKLKYGTSTQLGIKPTRDCVILKVQNIYNGNCIENFTFYSCYVDQLSPHIGIAMVNILERLGHEFSYPEGQTCCGQPATFSKLFFQNF